MPLSTVRFLAHPVRAALLVALREKGPCTATELAKVVDESPSNCSYHLRSMEALDLVKRESKEGRRVFWDIESAVISTFELIGPSPDQPNLQLSSMLASESDRSAARWRETGHRGRADWWEASFDIDVVLHLTPSDLVSLRHAIELLVAGSRQMSGSSSDASPVHLVLRGYPHIKHEP